MITALYLIALGIFLLIVFILLFPVLFENFVARRKRVKQFNYWSKELP